MHHSLSLEATRANCATQHLKKAKAGDSGPAIASATTMLTNSILKAALQPDVQGQSRLQSQCPRKCASTLQTDVVAGIELQPSPVLSPVRHS